MLSTELHNMADERNLEIWKDEEARRQELAERIEADATTYAKAGYYSYCWKPDVDSNSKEEINRVMAILRDDGFKIERKAFKRVYIISW